MDSIERMRKLNELTKELKNHGFAQSSFEAIQQANQIYGEDELTHEVKHGLIQNSAYEKMVNEDDNMTSDGNMINMEKKITKVSDSVEVLTTKLNEIIKAINDMDSRINALKSRPVERIVEKVVERPVQNTPQSSQEPSNVQPTVQEHVSASHQESAAPAAKDEYSMNQRVGNYQSQDVAIDKMFYFGKK
jgi:SMC interacting uncharacterized protein involved in chromosome segregation